MRSWITGLGTLFSLCLMAPDARAYCLTDVGGANPYVAWSAQPVTYRVSGNLTDTAILQAIDDAFASWQGVACSDLAFNKGSQFTMCTQSPCGAGAIPFNHTMPNIHIYWYTDPTGFPAAATYVGYTYLLHDGSGAIVAASIAINAFTYQWNATGGSMAPPILDVQNELTAFIGGAIGLADSNVPGATMYPPITYGDTTKRTLEQDDTDGLVTIYQGSGCPTPPPPGPNGCSTPPTPDTGPGPADGGADLSVAADLTATPDLSPPDGGSAADLSPDLSAGGDSSGTPDLQGLDSSGTLDLSVLDSGPSADLGPDLSSSSDTSGTSDLPTLDAAVTSDLSPVDGPGGGDAPAGADGPAGGDIGTTLELGGGPADGGPGGEPMAIPPPPEDTGCCRVSHARGLDSSAVLWILGLALLWARRRRARGG